MYLRHLQDIMFLRIIRPIKCSFKIQSVACIKKWHLFHNIPYKPSGFLLDYSQADFRRTSKMPAGKGVDVYENV